MAVVEAVVGEVAGVAVGEGVAAGVGKWVVADRRRVASSRPALGVERQVVAVVAGRVEVGKVAVRVVGVTVGVGGQEVEAEVVARAAVGQVAEVAWVRAVETLHARTVRKHQ